MDAPVDPREEGFVESLLERAAQASQAGRTADALESLGDAAARRPDDPRVQRALGRAWLEMGELANAIGSLRSAVSLDAAMVDAWLDLGTAYERAGDPRSALTCYDRATAVQPSFAQAWFRSAELAQSLGRTDDAIARFQRATEAGPTTRFGRQGAARALLAMNHDQKAEAVLREAIAVDPDDAVSQDLLGHLLSNWGRFDEAHACFLRAVETAPDLVGSYYELVRCRRVTPSEQGLLARMDSALARPGLAPVQRQRLHLAIGKAADDLGDPALAMKHFDAADALRPGSVTFDAAAFDEMIDGIIERCSPESMAQAPGRGNDDALPILIVGMPRSGTTLVEQIVSSHPEVTAGGELPFWTERAPAWHLDPSVARDAHFLPRAAALYLEFLRGIGPGMARVTDKMPFNVLWAGSIHLALPRATIVHCRRAPIDTALSIHQTMFHPNLAFPTGGSRLVAYFRSYERLTRHWQRVLPPDRYLEVDYDELTRDPEPVIRRVLDACGLPWNEACLSPHLKPGVVRTPSKWQARQPINRDSVERWRRHEPYLGPLRDLLDDPAPTS
jgi:tetratricopeptide (TPR) repeat protein